METSKTLSSLQIILAAVFLSGALVVSLMFAHNERTASVDRLITAGDGMSGLLAAGSIMYLRDGVEDSMHGLMLHLATDDQLAFARVFDREGNTVLSRGLPDTVDSILASEMVDSWERPDSACEVYRSSEDGRQYYVFRKAVADRDSLLGRVEIGYAVPPLVLFAGQGLRRGAPALAVLGVLLLVGSYLMNRLVGPLSALKQTVALANGDDFSSLASTLPQKGEAGEIGRSINTMLADLNSKYHTLLSSNRDLQVSNRVMLFEKRRTESIIDGLSDGVIVIDAYDRVSLMNREAEALLQIERGDAHGKLPAEVIRQKELAELLSNGEDIGRRRKTVEMEFSNGNGNSNRIIRISITALRGQADKQVGRMVVLRDVTQSKMEETARRDFISNVAHELRSPLTSIKSYVEMLIDNEVDKPELRAEFFNTINEEADRLARLIDNMLNISKIEIGGLVLNKSDVKTRKLVEDAAASIAGSAKSKNIKLTLNLPDDLPDAVIDKEMVRTSLMNLLGNAIKYTEAGGSVTVYAEVDAEQFHVSVIDTGWGIPADEQSKIFEKFYRGRQTAKVKVTGNGLGLALAREIALLHGGDLTLQSEEGKGSTFSLHLPLR